MLIQRVYWLMSTILYGLLCVLDTSILVHRGRVMFEINLVFALKIAQCSFTLASCDNISLPCC